MIVFQMVGCSHIFTSLTTLTINY